jgi:hypothetical protein
VFFNWSREVQGFLNLMLYFEYDPLPNPSPSTLFDFLIFEKSCNWFISRNESFFSSSYVPLSADSVIETDIMVSLVTGLLEHCAIYFPFSHFFLCSSDSSSNVCEEDAKAFF